MEIGNKINQLRKLSGMTQEQAKIIKRILT